MALALTPRLLRRGLELFALISLAGVGGLLFYGNNLQAFLGALFSIHWGWLVTGLGLASMDWVGGGTRLWVVARQVHPGVRLRDMIIAGGMSAWAAYLTPFQTGAGPTMMWAMRRAGVRLPEAMTSTFMTFVVHWLASRLERRSRRIAARIEQLRGGIDRAHECLVAFGNPRGWLALLWAVLLSGPSHANKLLAGYVALRALGIPANFVDILLLQTFITFLLYFAPTPGASGLAELLSAAVMSIYVPREITPTYILIWRFINSYATVIVGSLLFWRWLRRGLIGKEEPVGVA